MSKEKRRVPKLRFPEFTEDWEQRKLGEFVKIVSGDAPSTFISGNCIYVKVDDLNYSDRIQLSSSNLVNANPKAHLVNQGATIFPKRGAAIMTNKVRIMGKDGYLDTNMMALIPEEIDKDFLFTFIQKTGLYKIADTSTIPQINNKHIEPYMIQVPSEKEQAYIGVVFKQIDKIITLHQRKLDNLKLKKKALLQKLFPKNGERYPELRFPGFTDAWEQRKLGDIATFSKGNGYSKSDLASSGDPIILYGRLYTNYETTISNIDTFVELKDKSVISQGGEVIVPASGETAEDISRASVVKKQGIIIGGDLNIIKANHLLDPTFLALTISNGEQQKELSKRAQGKSVVHLHNSDLQEVNLTFPVLDEQKEISTLFKKMDNIITLHQRKLDHLQLQKKALLQQMFV